MRIDPRLDKISDCLYRLSVKAIIVDNKKLLMVHEPEGWYGLPGGGVKHGEDILDALKRELHEEIATPLTNIIIANDTIHMSNKAIVDTIPYFNIFYTVLLRNPKAIGHSKLHYKWVSPNSLRKLSLAPSVQLLKKDLLLSLV